jgi:predicted choloylglycine hydrolase
LAQAQNVFVLIVEQRYPCAAGSSIKDESRSLAVGLQEQAANHHKRLRPKSYSRERYGKGIVKGIRYESEKTNTNELPLKCRKS